MVEEKISDLTLERRLTYRDAAEIVGVSATEISRLVRTKALVAHDWPGSTRKKIRLGDLLAFLASRKRTL